MLHGRLQNRQLTRLQFDEVLRLPSPFDFGIVRQSASAGAGHVGQDAIKGSHRRELAYV